MYRIGDEDCGVVGYLPRQILGEALCSVFEALLDRPESAQRVGPGGLVDPDQRGGAAIEARLTIEIGGTQLQPRDIAEAQHGPVRVGPDHDIGEFLGRGEPPLGLDVELELLIVRDRPCANAANRRLDVLSLDGLDDVVRRQVQPGSLKLVAHIKKGPHCKPHPQRRTGNSQQLFAVDHRQQDRCNSHARGIQHEWRDEMQCSFD